VTDSHDPAGEDRPMSQAERPDPAAFQLRGDPPRVVRLSRKALAVVGVAAGLGIGGSLIYALRPPGEKAAQELYNTDSRATAETITSGPRDYAQAPRLGPPLPGDLGRPIVSAQQRGEDVPVPPIGAQPAQPDPRVRRSCPAARATRTRRCSHQFCLPRERRRRHSIVGAGLAQPSSDESNSPGNG
jgi:type IV secretion system protein TrbI